MTEQEQVEFERRRAELLGCSIRAKQEKLHSAVLVKVCGDERLRSIVQVFESGDERRRETMFRMACALGRHSL